MYYRVTKLLGQIYAARFNSVYSTAKEIEQLIFEGEVVLLCDDLEAAAEIFNVAVEEIKIIN